MKFNRGWFIVCCVFLAYYAYAQEQETADLLGLSLEELTQVKFSSSSFFDQEIGVAPGYNLVIDMEAVEQSASRTLGEVLSSRAPGINVSRHERQGVLLGTRGLMIDNNAKTNVMLDGQSINQRVHFGTMISIDSPLIGDLQRLELSFIFRSEQITKHKIAVGAEYGERQFNNKECFFRSTSEEGLESVDFDWKTVSAYAEDIYSVSDQITLLYGIRYDRVDYGLFCGDEGDTCLLRNANLSSEDHWSPRVAIAYALNLDTIVKFSCQHGFRYPDAVYYQWKPFWDDIIPGTGLDIESESLDSFEINLNSQLSDTVAIDGNLYYNQHKDTLSFVFFDGNDGYHSQSVVDQVKDRTDGFFGAFVNSLNDFEAVGGEVVVNWKPKQGHAFTISYGYSELHNEAPSQNRFPQHLLKMSLTNTFFWGETCHIG